MAFRILSVIIILSSLVPVYAQQVKIDSVRADTLIRNRFVPTGLRIGVDVISPVKTRSLGDFTGWEVNADVDLHRYLIAADIGSWGRTFVKDSASYSSAYSNDGKYWRVGVDANFLTRDPDRNVFYLGFRYARSKYSETMTISATDTLWGDINAQYANHDRKAGWLELNAGLKVKVYKFLWMGYRGSMKFGLKKNDDGEMLTHDVPGYGSTDRDTTWGFTYSIYIRIPFRKTVPILPPKKK
jgi:hypothetical protein